MSGPRPPLLLIAITGEAERLRGALTLACAEVALGGAVRLFLQLDAVSVLQPPIVAPLDDGHVANGLPRLVGLIDDALDLGVEIVVCQSGLALAGMRADDLDPRISASGPVAMLAEAGPDARVVIA